MKVTNLASGLSTHPRGYVSRLVSSMNPTGNDDSVSCQKGPLHSFLITQSQAPTLQDKGHRGLLHAATHIHPSIASQAHEHQQQVRNHGES